MTAERHGGPLRVAIPHVPSLGHTAGVGSVFAKTLRDSRLAVVLVTGVLGAIILAGGAAMSTAYGTPALRLELAAMTGVLPPVLRGVYGDPVRVDTLGGFLSWHYGAYFGLLGGLWSILALSSTLAGEARRGNLDFTLATPHSRRAIAIEKVAGHVAAMALVMGLVTLIMWGTGVVLATLPGDAIPPGAAASFALGFGAKALMAGSIAFALAPVLGRGAAAGIAGAVMVAGYVIHGYRTVVPAFDALDGVTWYAWVARHIPLAGQDDGPAVGAVALGALLLLAIGVEAFARRDVGPTAAIPTPAMPAVLLGIRGPLRRSFGDLLPGAFAWGVGLGLYGLVIAASSGAVADALADFQAYVGMIGAMFPGVDMTSAAGFLQLAFVELGLILVGLAATTLVASRASDEQAGRLELQLATPLTRARWSIASTVAVWLAIALVTAILAASIAVGVALVGQDPVGPLVGTGVLALYGMALAGIGIAAGGLLRASLAGPIVLAMTIGTALIDLLGPALKWPDWAQQLALSAHLGEPMIGTWDPVGMAACVAIAVGGLVLGAWGLRRRDIAG